MRKPFIAGNWKLNLLGAEAAALADVVVESAKDVSAEVGIAPTYAALTAVAGALRGSAVRLIAQNVFWEDAGAFTGEVSAPMLKDLGVTHVIIGHSERRQFFGETDATVNKRLQAAIKHRLVPIFCIGETLVEREAGETLAVLERQVRGGLAGISTEDAAAMVLAYEPVWAIGTGMTASPQQAQDVHAFIRKLLGQLYSPAVADQVRIQYGGSVKPDNVKTLMAQPDIDGALVGGASLKSGSFVPIIRFQK
jgi:triosephosphate isomerase (TIM)